VNPDVVRAVDDLARRGALSRASAPRLRRAASGSLISVRGELQALLYAGVLLVATGTGLLVKEHYLRIGPLTIAFAIGACAAACLAWTARRAPAFAWSEVPSPDLAFDYVLLLGSLLAAADLAFVEANFTPLGTSWPWHLLIVAIVYGTLALRFDSKTLFSLALTSLAAWRGVRIWVSPAPWDAPMEERFFVEALVCGAAFVLLGTILERADRKAHFEPVATWLGWLLVIGAWTVRACQGGPQVRYEVALLLCAALLAWFSFEERRIGLTALGLAAAGLAAGLLASEIVRALFLGASALYLLVLLIAAAVIVILHRANAAIAAGR
jgi:hypothetical protein